MPFEAAPPVTAYRLSVGAEFDVQGCPTVFKGEKVIVAEATDWAGLARLKGLVNLVLDYLLHLFALNMTDSAWVVDVKLLIVFGNSFLPLSRRSQPNEAED